MANNEPKEVSSLELELTDDQEMLRSTTERFISATCPLTVVRQLAESIAAPPTGYVAAAADLGWFAMLVPEDDGGGTISGEGLRDVAIIAEERGRQLQPGPFVSMNVVADSLAVLVGDGPRRSLLALLAAGQTVAAWAVASPAGDWSPGTAVHAEPTDGGWELSGRTSLVQDALGAEWLLVTANAPEGLTQFLVEAAHDGVSVEPVHTLDITQRFANVSFEKVQLPWSAVVGEVGGAESAVERQLQIAVVLNACETIGAMTELFELTRQYAIDRTAFGRPIGSFQAIKHQLADLSLALECSKAIAASAVLAVQDRRDDAGEVVSMAKAWIAERGVDISQGCLQVFAGIGFTWEHDSHLFVRRITMFGALLGSTEWHLERICALHGL